MKYYDDEERILIDSIEKGEGVPYQTLVSSVLHKYAKEKLVETEEKS